MTPRSRRCFITHTEYMSITPREKACLSVSRRRPCPSEQGDPLESEQRDPLHQVFRSWNVGNAQIRTLLDRQREQILANCHAEIKEHEFQANYDLRSVQKLSETIESQQGELHRAQAEELQRRDQQLLHERFIAAKFSNMSSLHGLSTLHVPATSWVRKRVRAVFTGFITRRSMHGRWLALRTPVWRCRTPADFQCDKLDEIRSHSGDTETHSDASSFSSSSLFDETSPSDETSKQVMSSLCGFCRVGEVFVRAMASLSCDRATCCKCLSLIC